MANLYARNNMDEYSTKVMMAYPITPLARMIGRCWFLGPEKLAERAGVTVRAIQEVLRGREIGKESERRIKEALGLCTNTKVSS